MTMRDRHGSACDRALLHASHIDDDAPHAAFLTSVRALLC